MWVCVIQISPEFAEVCENYAQKVGKDVLLLVGHWADSAPILEVEGAGCGCHMNFTTMGQGVQKLMASYKNYPIHDGIKRHRHMSPVGVGLDRSQLTRLPPSVSKSGHKMDWMGRAANEVRCAGDSPQHTQPPSLG